MTTKTEWFPVPKWFSVYIDNDDILIHRSSISSICWQGPAFLHSSLHMGGKTFFTIPDKFSLRNDGVLMWSRIP